MKKNKIISGIMMSCMVLGLAACGGDKEQIVSCEMSQGPTTIVMDLHAEGDTIVKIVQNAEVDITGMDDEQIQMLEDAIVQTEELVGDMSGVTYSTEVGDDVMTETFEILTEGESLQEVIEKGLLPITGDNVERLSLEQSVEQLEASGWTVSE